MLICGVEFCPHLSVIVWFQARFLRDFLSSFLLIKACKKIRLLKALIAHRFRFEYFFIELFRLNRELKFGKRNRLEEFFFFDFLNILIFQLNSNRYSSFLSCLGEAEAL